MNVYKLLNVSNLAELRSLGGYREIKIFVEEKIDNKLGVNGWKNLLSKLQNIKCLVYSNKHQLLALLQELPFTEAKKVTSEKLDLHLIAKNPRDLEKKLHLIVDFFSIAKVFDPYEYYEQNKLQKFKDSAKLEGINIEFQDEVLSLEHILARYRG